MPTVLDVPVIDAPPDDDGISDELLPERYEVVHGKIVELPPMSDYARAVANRLNNQFVRYLATNDIGDSVVEILFRIPLREDRSRNRQPDVAFVSYERWARDRPHPFTGNPRNVVPDIAVEVVSPGDSADSLLEKAREYLRGGVRLVWVVYPLAREVHVYLPGAGTIRAFVAEEELDAGDILPGFRTSVAALFPPREEPTPVADE